MARPGGEIKETFIPQKDGTFISSTSGYHYTAGEVKAFEAAESQAQLDNLTGTQTSTKPAGGRPGIGGGVSTDTRFSGSIGRQQVSRSDRDAAAKGGKLFTKLRKKDTSAKVAKSDRATEELRSKK